MMSSDEKFVERLKGGDREAQRELYDRYSAALMSIAVRYMGDIHAAEDVLHDAFIKIFTSVAKFTYRGEGSLRAWMSRIVVNQSLEELRRTKRSVVSTVDIGSVGEKADVEAHAVQTIPSSVMQQFIAQLPDGYRTVFNLFCIDGYSHRQIAVELGINEKSSSSQLLRAKRMLAIKIREYLDINE